MLKPINGKTAGIAYTLSALLPYIFQLVILLVVTVLLGSFGITDSAEVTGNKFFIWMLMVVNQFAFGASVYFATHKSGVGFQRIVGLKKPLDAEYAALGIAFALGLLFFMSPIVTYFIIGLEHIGYVPAASILPPVDSVTNLFMSLLVIAVFPAIFEETLFRGVIVKGMKGYGAAFSVLMSTVFFVLMHQNIEQVIYQFALGAALAYVALKTESVKVPALMHFVSNATVLVVSFVSSGMGMGEGGAVLGWEWIAMAVGGLAVAAIIVYEFVVKRKKGETLPPATEPGEEVMPKKVMFAYAAVGLLFNVILLILNLFHVV